MERILSRMMPYNYWQKPPEYNLGLKRKSYIKALKNALNNQLIKVIVGQRRVGKSFIIRQLIDYLITNKKVNSKNIFYLNKELYEFEPIKSDTELYELITYYRENMATPGKKYFFIDEVQEIENWEKVIVSLAQNPADEVEIIITGSNSKLLSGELATKLTGRYILFNVFPFTYSEFCSFHHIQNTKENFIDYLQGSSLPEVNKLQDTDTKRFYLQSLKNTVLLRDIISRYNIRDSALLHDLFLFLIHNTGNMTSIPSIIKYFKSKNRKTDYSTLSNYLSFIENSFIIHSSPRYYIKNKETLSGEKKFYLNDLGFRNFLYPNLVHEIASGLENVVYIHLLKAGYDVYTGFGRDFEIDFVAIKQDTILYIQVTYLLESETTIEREFGAFQNIRDFYPKYVLSMDDMQISNYKGINHKSIWDFLYNI